MRKFGIIGRSLSHSFSPAYFAEKFFREGLTGYAYNAYPLADIDELPALLKANPDLVGLNVTIPYKKAVLSYLNKSTPAVREAGACNCIQISNGQLEGHNTDVIGFEQSLTPLLSDVHTHALILGTGGAASAVAYVLTRMGIDFLTVTRKLLVIEKHITYAQLTGEILKTHKLIINTTPVGMEPHVDECPDISYEQVGPQHLLYDLIYNPAETLFLAKGRDKGASIKNGLEMLQLQAEASWKIWNEGAGQP